MTFDEFSSERIGLKLSGAMLSSLVLLLEKKEDSLDKNQLAALNIFRNCIYERLSLEQMEKLGTAYRESCL